MKLIEYEFDGSTCMFILSDGAKTYHLDVEGSTIEDWASERGLLVGCSFDWSGHHYEEPQPVETVIEFDEFMAHEFDTELAMKFVSSFVERNPNLLKSL